MFIIFAKMKQMTPASKLPWLLFCLIVVFETRHGPGWLGFCFANKNDLNACPFCLPGSPLVWRLDKCPLFSLLNVPLLSENTRLDFFKALTTLLCNYLLSICFLRQAQPVWLERPSLLGEFGSSKAASQCPASQQMLTVLNHCNKTKFTSQISLGMSFLEYNSRSRLSVGLGVQGYTAFHSSGVLDGMQSSPYKEDQGVSLQSQILWDPAVFNNILFYCPGLFEAIFMQVYFEFIYLLCVPLLSHLYPVFSH